MESKIPETFYNKLMKKLMNDQYWYLAMQIPVNEEEGKEFDVAYNVLWDIIDWCKTNNVGNSYSKEQVVEFLEEVSHLSFIDGVKTGKNGGNVSQNNFSVTNWMNNKL
jgi:hypothetical protein